MLLTLLTLPLILGSPWIFLYLSPGTRHHRQLKRYNALALTLTMAICLVAAVLIRAVLAGTDDQAWWPVVALVASAIAFPVLLLGFGLVRNFALFTDRADRATQRIRRLEANSSRMMAGATQRTARRQPR